MAGAASAQTVGSRAPAAEAMAALYINAFVNFDTGAVKQLNDRLRPLYENGQDAMNAKDVEAMVPANIASTADTLKEDAEIKNPKLDAAIDSFSKSLWGALKSSKCAVTGSVVKPNTAVRGELIAEVKYECLVADLAPGMASVKKTHGKYDAQKTGRSADYFNQLSNVYGTARLTHRLCSSMTLFHSQEHPEIWSTGGPGDVTSTVLTWLVLAYKPRDLLPGIFQPCKPAA
jgi:hypothetical protein